MSKTLKAADLFCGAGGTSLGLLHAAQLIGQKVELAAVNHWPRAVETHAANHPDANHFCEDLTSMDPKKAVPGGKLDLLVASPECTHHSVARGGKPVNDQSRASAWCVLRWATALRVDRVLIENVSEFRTWGPLGANGRPLKSRRGETFAAFVKALESLGYRVEWRILNAADYGDATTRRRLFLQAALGRRPIRWPVPTHAADQRPGFFEGLKPWRAAREVIDWSLPGESIFGRKRPLSANTLRRIEAGLRKFGGPNAEPFLVAMNYLSSREHDGRYTRRLGDPVPTITGQGNRFYLVEPYIVNLRGTDPNGLAATARPLGKPLPTVTGGEHVGLCEPMVMSAGGPEVAARPVSEPLNTVLTRDHMALVEPFVLQMSQSGSNGRRMRPVDDPLPTVTTADDLAVVSPFLIHTTHHGSDRVNGVDKPIPTVTGANRGEQALVQPFITSFKEGIDRRVHSIGQPLPTQTTEKQFGLCEPFLVPYYGTGVPDSVDEPMSTVTTKDRLGLVEPQPCCIDIRFRMLAPHELAGAMGFPRDYKFTGNRGEQVKQIGNAVAVNQAAALCRAMLEAS